MDGIVKVYFEPSSLWGYKLGEITAAGETVGEVIKNIADESKIVREKLFDKQGNVKDDSFSIFLDGINVKSLGYLDTPIGPKARELKVLPKVGA